MINPKIEDQDRNRNKREFTTRAAEFLLNSDKNRRYKDVFRLHL